MDHASARRGEGSGNLVDRLARWGFALAGLPSFSATEWTWKKADAWDRGRANKSELVDREHDMERVQDAIALYETDKGAAFEIWFDLAQQGSVWSMLEIARCFEHGEGVARDVAQAEHWYKRALGGGSQIAMLHCARFAADRCDFTACEAILSVGVMQDWVPAIFWLAWYRLKQSESRKTYLEVRPLLETAARQGHPAAQWLLVRFMARGKFGLRKVLRGHQLGWERSKASLAELEATTDR